MDDFAVSINRVLGNEGGYVNDPADPGGETNWGISKRSYPNLDIASLTRDDAVAIYRTDFWDRIGADRLPRALGYQLLDFAVNSGISTAIRKLQSVVGVADDGHWGPVSSTALATRTTADVTFRLIGERLLFMTKLKNWKYNAGGWAVRIAKDISYAADDIFNHEGED